MATRDVDSVTPVAAARALEKLIEAPDAYRRVIAYLLIVRHIDGGRPVPAVYDVPCRRVVSLARFYEHLRYEASRARAIKPGKPPINHAAVVWATPEDVQRYRTRFNVRQLPTIGPVWTP